MVGGVVLTGATCVAAPARAANTTAATTATGNTAPVIQRLFFFVLIFVPSFDGTQTTVPLFSVSVVPAFTAPKTPKRVIHPDSLRHAYVAATRRETGWRQVDTTEGYEPTLTKSSPSSTEPGSLEQRSRTGAQAGVEDPLSRSGLPTATSSRQQIAIATASGQQTE